jgi:hypothetical protein
MNTQLLIDAVVRQTTILIAQLATAGGARTPLSDVAGQVFVDLARELHRQGVSRKVAADMFGLALRTYRRKIQRLTESETLAGRSLWEAVHDFIGAQPVVTRADVLRRFHRDDESTVRGVLQDLVESGLVYQAGRGAASSYRVATPADLDYVRENEREADGTDTLVWAIVYRLGPLSRGKLAENLSLPATKLDVSIARLLDAGRIVLVEGGGEPKYRAPSFVLPLGTSQGWEAAIFDHFQAVVNTICHKLRHDPGSAGKDDRIGGSTYSLEVWPGHPLEEEASGALKHLREYLGDLRRRIAAHNAASSLPAKRTRVVAYAGQFIIDREEASDVEGEEDASD